MNLLKQENEFQSKVIIDYSDKIKRQDKQIKESRDGIQFYDKFVLINPFIKNLVQNEINNNLQTFNNGSKFGCRYSLETKMMCYYLYSMSPKVYRNFSLFFTWPTKSTLNKLIDENLMQTGIQSNIFEYIKSLKFDKEVCVLMLDEVHLRPHLSYSNGKIIGKCDMGGFGVNKKEPADLALTFMIGTYSKSIKIPLGYFFNHSTVPAKCLKEIVDKVIVDLYNVDIHVKVLVCDQGVSNLSLSRILNISVDQPYFDVEINEDSTIRIYFLFDVPHLLKSIRNNFIKYPVTFEYDGDSYTANWNIVQTAYLIDKRNDLSMIPKITDKHINPSKFQQMKVKYAAHVFSRSYSAAIKTMSEDKEIEELNINNSKGTYLFLQIINDVFDVMNNSDSFESKIFKEGSESFFNLVELMSIIESMKFQSNTNITSLNNLLISISSIFFLQKDLSTNYSIDYILTKRLNQDPLENFFSMIRFHAKENNGLRFQSFRSSYLSLSFTSFFKRATLSVNKNCEDDGFLFSSILPLVDNNNNKNKKNIKPIDRTSLENEEESIVDIDFDIKNSNFFSNVSDYVSGFILRKIKKFICKECFSQLHTNTECSNFINNKTFKGCNLYTPSSNFAKFLETFTAYFFSEIDETIYEEEFKQILCNNFLNSPGYFSISNSLNLHCKEIIISKSLAFIFVTLVNHKIKCINTDLDNRFKKMFKVLEMKAKKD